MIVYCRTAGDESDYYAVARVILTPETAHSLLGYRDLVAAAKAYDGSFYALVFFDHTPDFGEYPSAILHEDDLEHGEWAVVEEPPEFELQTTEARPSSLYVKEDGVYWVGTNKYASGEFETETLSWAELEAVENGEDPFDAEEAAGDGAEGEEDDDGEEE